jgi:hypothetical protein
MDMNEGECAKGRRMAVVVQLQGMEHLPGKIETASPPSLKPSRSCLYTLANEDCFLIMQ